MRGVAGLVAGLCCALVIACAASSSRMTSQAPVAPQAGTTAAGASDAHAQIEELDRQITADRERMNLPAPSVAAQPMAAGSTAPAPATPAVPPGQDQLCHHAASDTCTTSCGLADAICTNAGKICTLAKQLPGDAWADGKCATASQSCDDARGRCCGCT